MKRNTKINNHSCLLRFLVCCSVLLLVSSAVMVWSYDSEFKSSLKSMNKEFLMENFRRIFYRSHYPH